MPREDYDEIKKKFSTFISMWNDKNVKEIDTMIDPEIICFMSVEKAYTCGSKHSKYGICDFINDMAPCDVFHTRICNYVCRVHDEEAHQSAHIAGLAVKIDKADDKVKTFEFTAMLSNHWEKKRGSWIMTELRMDIINNGGDFVEFADKWYFEEATPKTFPGLHLPCINGELDSPWNRIPEAEDVLSDEEKIIETFSQYAFGIDYLVFDHVMKAATDDVISIIAPWGAMDLRTWISALKYHRQKDRYWGHPGKPGKITIHNDEASMEIYRMAGHKQRSHPYIYTQDNINEEHACAFYKLRLRKSNGNWKISHCQYYLGIVELGLNGQCCME